MSAENTQSSKVILNEEQGKYRKGTTGLQIIFNFLQDHIATATMVSDATGLPQKSICRYKRTLEKEGRLYEVEKKPCEITGFSAWYLTTNSDLFPESNQLEMFDDGK
jgi:hypothetical protein